MHVLACRIRRCLLCATVAVLVSGCGSSGPERYPLTGAVTIDGQPVQEGMIAFNPAPGTDGPAGGGEIKGGRYALDSDNGPVAGRHSVEIRGMRKSDRKRPPDAPGAGQIVEKEQYLPEKFNAATTLEATIDSKTKSLDFNLKK